MFNYLIALANVCNDYHSGQWSKGYRLLCVTQYYLEKWYGVTHVLDRQMSNTQWCMYNILRKKYERVL